MTVLRSVSDHVPVPIPVPVLNTNFCFTKTRDQREINIINVFKILF